MYPVCWEATLFARNEGMTRRGFVNLEGDGAVLPAFETRAVRPPSQAAVAVWNNSLSGGYRKEENTADKGKLWETRGRKAEDLSSAGRRPDQGESKCAEGALQDSEGILQGSRGASGRRDKMARLPKQAEGIAGRWKVSPLYRRALRAVWGIEGEDLLWARRPAGLCC